MKTFIRGLAIFMLPVLLMIAGFEFLLRKIPNDYSYKKNYLDTHAKNIKTLFLGNSHTYYGIDPAYIKSPSFNAAYVSQTLAYDDGIIQKYAAQFDSLQYIVLGVDYCDLYSSLEMDYESFRVKDYNLYYHIYKTNDLRNYFEVLSNKLKPNLSRCYAFYRRGIAGLTSSALGWGTNYNFKKQKNLIETGKEAAERHTPNTDKYVPQNVATLQSIVKFAKTKGIQVIMFTSPAWKTYCEHLDEHQLTNTIQAVTEITNTYPNVQYYNLLNDSSFEEKDFYDADHLDETGAKKLSLKIDSLINQDR